MQLIKTLFYLVSMKVNDKEYPVIAFDTREKAEQYVGDNAYRQYVIDCIDTEYDLY